MGDNNELLENKKLLENLKNREFIPNKDEYFNKLLSELVGVSDNKSVDKKHEDLAVLLVSEIIKLLKNAKPEEQRLTTPEIPPGTPTGTPLDQETPPGTSLDQGTSQAPVTPPGTSLDQGTSQAPVTPLVTPPVTPLDQVIPQGTTPETIPELKTPVDQLTPLVNLPVTPPELVTPPEPVTPSEAKITQDNGPIITSTGEDNGLAKTLPEIITPVIETQRLPSDDVPFPKTTVTTQTTSNGKIPDTSVISYHLRPENPHQIISTIDNLHK